MFKYRINISLANPREELDYYIAAEFESDAKKYFLGFMIEAIKKEQIIFDNIHFFSNGFEVIAKYKGEIYLHGKLCCLPNRYKKIGNIDHLTQATILDDLTCLCKTSNKSVLKNIWQGQG